MNNKKLGLLGGAVLLFLLLFVLSNRAEDRAIRRETVRLLSDVNTDEISAIAVQKGKEEAKLAFHDGKWTVVDRANYPADGNKLRSIMLKLIELSLSQKVTDAEKNHAALGVAAESVEKGSTRVRMLGSGNKELASLILGEKRKPGKSPMATDAQFVRRESNPAVYLSASAIEVPATPPAWLSTELLSVQESKVKRILQEELSEVDAAERRQKVFEIKALSEADGKPKFELDLRPANGEEVQEPVLNSISGGLENVRIVDVQPAAAPAEELKSRKFDRLTTYETSAGAVYEVRTLAVGTRIFAKIDVRFSPELAKATEAETAAQNEKRKQEFEAKKKAAEEKKEEYTGPKEFSPVAPDVTTPEAVQKLAKEYASWIYEFANFQGEKFRRGKADLLKTKAPEPEPPAE